MATPGIRYSTYGGNTGFLYTERRDFNLASQTVKEMFPTVAPFTTFVTKLRSSTTNDPDFE